jgi:hypothetical protein
VTSTFSPSRAPVRPVLASVRRLAAVVESCLGALRLLRRDPIGSRDGETDVLPCQRRGMGEQRRRGFLSVPG